MKQAVSITITPELSNTVIKIDYNLLILPVIMRDEKGNELGTSYHKITQAFAGNDQKWLIEAEPLELLKLKNIVTPEPPVDLSKL